MIIRFSQVRRLGSLAAIALYGLLAMPAAGQEWRPVEGAGGWRLSDRLPGVEQRTCSARIVGPEANITLLINRDGVPVLMLGRPDWNNRGDEIRIALSIDGAAPMALRGSAVANLVLILVQDAALLERLRTARMLHWTFPFGRFRTGVEGFGIALDALRACHNPAPAGT